MSIPETALLLGGFVLAHAIWNVSDLPKGEALVPLAIVEREGQRQLLRFEANTQEEAIQRGKSEMAKLTGAVDAWAFARDGLMGDLAGTGPKVDAISVDVWAKGMPRPITIVQRYEPFARHNRFRVIGEPEIFSDQSGTVVKSTIEDAGPVKDLVDRIQKGIDQHPVAGNMWDSWKRSE